MRHYWVCQAAQEHVNIVRDKGYTQVNMGPRGPLETMNTGDWILYYSPTIYYGQDLPSCEQFSGISCVNDSRVYPQGGQFPDRWRRNVDFFHCNPHHPAIFVGKVSFLPDHETWQDVLTQSFFEIPRNDFLVIAQTILVETPEKIPLL